MRRESGPTLPLVLSPPRPCRWAALIGALFTLAFSRSPVAGAVTVHPQDPSASDSRIVLTTDRAPDNPTPAAQRSGPWHLDFGFRTVYPKLGWTDQMLDRRLEQPLKLDVLNVFDHPTTPMDRRSDFEFNSLFIGLGRTESDRFVWSIYAGAAAGSDKSDERFLNTTLDVRFRYGFYYLGSQFEYYPWGLPPLDGKLDSMPDRLRMSRPFLFTGFESAFVNSIGKGDYRISGVVTYSDSVSVRDWLFSVPLGLGCSMPLNERWSFQLMGDYRFHFYRPEEFNGWHIAAALRLRL